MRILHFSDFHITKSGLSNVQDNVDRMINAIKSYISDERPLVDIIIFTGDMADQGGKSFESLKEGLQAFYENVVKKLCSDLNVPEHNFFVCPGNHEVDRNSIVKETDYKLERELTSPDKLHNYLINDSRNQGFSERLKIYDESFRQPWLQQMTTNPTTKYKHTVKLADHFIIEIEGRKIGVSCLNSAWRCGAKIEQNREVTEGWEKCPQWIKKALNRFGLTPKREEIVKYEEIKGEYNYALIGATQMTEARNFFDKADVALRLSLAHHHFSVLGPADWYSLDSNFRDNYDMCFFGHTHGHHTDQHNNTDGSMICSIAPSTKRENEPYTDGFQNGFSLWDVDLAKGIARESVFLLDKGTIFKPISTEPYPYLLDTKLIYPLSDLLKKILKSIDIDSDSLADIRKKIINSDAQELLVYGVSGIGKTYQVSKALDQIQADPLLSGKEVFYCEAKIDDDGQLFKELTKKLGDFFDRHRDDYLILDNCTIPVLQDVVRQRDLRNSSVKIVGLTNHYDEHDFKFSGIKTISITDRHSEEAVNNYIDTHIFDYRMRESIKRYSSGFPIIAIKLVEQAVENNALSIKPGDVGIHSLVQSLGRDTKESKDLEELLTAMALFQPFPKLNSDSMAIWRMKSLSTLHSKSREEIVELIDKARRLWQGTLVESTPSGYTIRPYLLAVHLASQWFEKNNSDEHFTELIKELTALSDGDRGMAVSALSRRLRDLNMSEGARRLFEKLNEEKGFFRSENVVFSEVGSQLILASANVNPAPLALSLRSVISQADEKVIRGLHYMVRRNLVSALTQLACYAESFDDAMIGLAVLAYYEEEDILNNATGTFQSYWHIVLPGTSASLYQRVAWLRKHTSADPRIKQLLPLALKGAFAAGMFSRIGSVGSNNGIKSDYHPTYDEIREYWKECTELAVAEIDENKNREKYVEIVNSNIHAWCRHGLIGYVIVLIEEVSLLENNGWRILENEYNDIIRCMERLRISSVFIDRFKSLKDIIVLSDFLSRLKSRQKDYYESSPSWSDFESEIQFYMPLVKEMIVNEKYKDVDTITSLLDDRHFVFFSFCIGISREISDNQLSEMFEQVLSSPVLSDELVSPFLLSIVSCVRDKSSVNKFIEEVYHRKFYKLYTALMARLEDDKLTSFYILDHKFNDNSYNYFPVYLNHVSTTHTVLAKLLPVLSVKIDANMNDVIFYLVTHYGFVKLSHDAEKYCKDMVLKFDLGSSYPTLTQSYSLFVSKLLKENKDDVFAKEICRKYLSAPYETYDSHAFTSIFKVILDDYLENGISILLEALMDASFFSVAYRLAQDLGSGMGFGTGSFFTLDPSFLSSLLDKHGVKLARVYATMCPIFNKPPYECMEFTEWVRILLDNYGDDKETRDNLSMNMGSFAWSGSIIPLLDAKIRGFKQLENHERSEVRKWVNANLNDLEQQRDYERVVEDYRAHLYE